MTHPAKAQEPSMDEIIASIRRMISPDNRVKDDAPATSELPPSPPAPPSATPTNPVSAPLTASAPPVRTSAPNAPVFSTRAGSDGADVRFGKRTFVGQSFAPPPQLNASSPAASPMSGQANMDTTTAARPAFPKTEPQITNAAAAPRTEVDSRAKPDLPTTPVASGRSDADYPRLRNNAAESPAAREASQPPDGAESLSPETAAAVGAALDALARSVAAQSPRSLEDVVRDTLRPMLKAWLDDNLPQLVERLVREEIERIARER